MAHHGAKLKEEHGPDYEPRTFEEYVLSLGDTRGGASPGG